MPAEATKNDERPGQMLQEVQVVQVEHVGGAGSSLQSLAIFSGFRFSPARSTSRRSRPVAASS